MPWGSVRGHDRVVESLRRSLAQGRLPHALLFVGPDGVGKRTFAMAMAQGLLCERRAEAALDPCGECPSCQQVIAGWHPDVIVVSRPEEKSELPISAIRDLCRQLGLKPMRGHRRVAIVDDADEMSDEAANAFLKTLEEPPPGSVLILIASTAESQLDTVISRCRVVRFQPLARPDIAAVLMERGLASTLDDADRLAKASEGSVARAEGLADVELERFRRFMVDEVANPIATDTSVLANRAEKCAKDAGKEGPVWRGRACLLIGELTRLFRAAILHAFGLAATYPDPADRLAAESLADRMKPEELFVLVERCLDAHYYIRRNISPGIVFEALFSDLDWIIFRREPIPSLEDLL